MANAEREEKKAARQAKRARRRETWSQLWAAFKVQRQQDKKLIPFMLLAFLAPIVVLVAISFAWGNLWINIITGVILGAALAMLVFSRRLQANVYQRAKGQPGAAGWALDNIRNSVGTVWITKQGVQMNQHMDMVHRTVGLPGVVLTGEGDPARLKPMLDKERKRLARIVGDTPIYEIIVGDGDGQVPIEKLQRHLVRLPRNIKRADVSGLANRIDSLDAVKGGTMQGLPKGPLPGQAKMAKGMNRRARRASQRAKKG